MERSSEGAEMFLHPMFANAIPDFWALLARYINLYDVPVADWQGMANDIADDEPFLLN